jgi:hypothetical protein
MLYFAELGTSTPLGPADAVVEATLDGKGSVTGLLRPVEQWRTGNTKPLVS